MTRFWHDLLSPLKRRPQTISVVVMVMLISGGAARVSAAELVMFESTACSWCETWHDEIGVIYDKTPEAESLPLRRVDVDDGRPVDLAHIGPIVYTPTFIALEKGVEVGRIVGYPGEDFFWQLLGEIVKKVKK